MHLGTFPDTLNPDEADFTQDALRILNGAPRENGLFGFDWTPEPALSIYQMAAVIRVAGVSIAAARLTSVLFSVAAFIPFYLLARRQARPWVALLATLLLATNLWFLNFSRSAWNNVQVSFWLLAATLLFLRAIDELQRRQRLPALLFAATGAACAFGLYGYFAGRAVLFALLACGPLLLWRVRGSDQRLRLCAGYAVLIGVAALLFAPEGVYIARHWEGFNSRAGSVLIVSSPEFKADPLGTLSAQVVKNAVAVWDSGVNNNPRYTPVGEPLLPRLVGLAVLFGMVISLRRAYRKRREIDATVWWIVLLVGWGTTEVLTRNTPDGARGVAWMPVLLLFAALGTERVAQWLDQRPVQVARAGTLGLWAIGLYTGVADVRHYLEWQANPATRELRQPYVTTAEFGQWAAEVEARAQGHRDVLNTGEWRNSHPAT